MTLDGGVDQIVRAPRQGDGPFRRQVLRAAREVGDDLQVDGRLVHGLQAAFAQVQQRGADGLHRQAGEQVGVREVLFQSNDARHRQVLQIVNYPNDLFLWRPWQAAIGPHAAALAVDFASPARAIGQIPIGKRVRRSRGLVSPWART